MMSGTSAYITVAKEVVTVAAVEASPEWKNFFLDTLRVNRTYEYDVVDVLHVLSD